jgi:hypothetical protein
MMIPDYAKNSCYKTLCGFAKRIGLEIIYRKHESFPNGALAFADVYNEEDGQHKRVVMPCSAEKILLFGKEPSAVLAHEIVHYLIEEFYRDDAIVNQESCYPVRLMLENDCDRMGLAIYLLAEAIASEEEPL